METTARHTSGRCSQLPQPAGLVTFVQAGLLSRWVKCGDSAGGRPFPVIGAELGSRADRSRGAPHRRGADGAAGGPRAAAGLQTKGVPGGVGRLRHETQAAFLEQSHPGFLA